jgi:hypothetical protein
MPRFFFHLHNDIDVPDDDGVELPDLDAAREYARENVLGIAGQTLKEQGRITLHHRIDIENEHGAVLETIMFRDVLHVED